MRCIRLKKDTANEPTYMFSLFSAVLIFLLKFVRFLLKLARKIVFFLPAARTELFSSILPAVPLHLQMVGEAEVHLLSVHYSDTVSVTLCSLFASFLQIG